MVSNNLNLIHDISCAIIEDRSYSDCDAQYKFVTIVYLIEVLKYLSAICDFNYKQIENLYLLDTLLKYVQ